MNGVTSPEHSPFTPYVEQTFNRSFEHGSGLARQPSFRNTSDLENVLETKDSRRIKAFLRNNHWPPNHEIRKVLWLKICQNIIPHLSTEVYEELDRNVFGEGRTGHDLSLPSFVDPENMVGYHLSETGRHKAKHMVCVINNALPDITFGPTIFAMTSLFLHYMESDDCYNCMYGLLRSPQNYLPQTKIAFDTSKYVLKELTRRYANSCYNYLLRQRHLMIETKLENWIWWIFKDLPMTHLVRVIDCFLYEGPKVLYRVALAILKLFYKHVKAENDMTDDISVFCQRMPYSAEKLLQVAFGIRGLSGKELKKMTVKFEMFVTSKRRISTLTQNLPRSASCESLNLKVSRSFSGPVISPPAATDMLDLEQVAFGLRAFSRKLLKRLAKKCKRFVSEEQPADLPEIQPYLLSLEIPDEGSLNSEQETFRLRGFSRALLERLTKRYEGIVGRKSEHEIGIALPTEEFNRSIDQWDGVLMRVRSRSHGSQNAMPFAKAKSAIINSNDWRTLWSWLPNRITVYQPELLFTTSEHGYSLTTFYDKLSEREQTLMIIKTKKDEVFGAYCSASWDERKKQDRSLISFGTGETFVFTLTPDSRKYKWVGYEMNEKTPASAQYYMSADNHRIAVGGGGIGYALQLDENLLRGRTDRCNTFDNSPLTPDKDFECVTLEVYGFK